MPSAFDEVPPGYFLSGDKPVSAQQIQALNRSDASVVSVDIPSGVDASTGEVAGAAVWLSF